MSLWDRLFRGRAGPSGPPGQPSNIDTDLVRRLGRNEAEVENLMLQWKGYKDELNRLVNRLEKRDQRAALKEAPPEEQPHPEDGAWTRFNRTRGRTG